jgi:RimJ/RimL family protein N-acetyltransferase
MDTQYPKTLKLKNGKSVEIRPLEGDDVGALVAFFKGLPEDSTQFLKEDVKDAKVVSRYVAEANPDLVWPIVAVCDGAIVADATLHMQQRGWRRHVGEVRVVVNPDFRRHRLAIALIHELVNQASLRKLKKLEAQILNSQKGALRAFQQLGFIEEATLKDHAMGAQGGLHDLIIMTNTVDDLWNKMEDMLHDMDIRREAF